jgi:hypothetical protein
MAATARHTALTAEDFLRSHVVPAVFPGVRPLTVRSRTAVCPNGGSGSSKGASASAPPVLFPIERTGTGAEQIKAWGGRLYGRLRSSRAERLALTRLLDLYLPFLRSDRLELRQGPAGPGVFARKRIKRGARLLLGGRRARLSDRDLRTLQRKQLDFSVVKAEDRRTYSLVGPVSLLNCGCVACVNVQEVDNWSRVQIVADIDVGEELLVSYCSSCSDPTCDSKHFLCPACKEHNCC